MIRVRMAAKYPGSTTWVVACPNFDGSVSAASVPHRAFASRPSSGSGDAAVASTTPGRALSRSRMLRMNAWRAAGSGSRRFGVENVSTAAAS